MASKNSPEESEKELPTSSSHLFNKADLIVVDGVEVKRRYEPEDAEEIAAEMAEKELPTDTGAECTAEDENRAIFRKKIIFALANIGEVEVDPALIELMLDTKVGPWIGAYAPLPSLFALREQLLDDQVEQDTVMLAIHAFQAGLPLRSMTTGTLVPDVDTEDSAEFLALFTLSQLDLAHFQRYSAANGLALQAVERHIAGLTSTLAQRAAMLDDENIKAEMEAQTFGDGNLTDFADFVMAGGQVLKNDLGPDNELGNTLSEVFGIRNGNEAE